jgi:ferredoxin-NADP reductase
MGATNRIFGARSPRAKHQIVSFSLAETPPPADKLEVVLTAIRLAARGTNLYIFERPDGGVLPAVTPGAHISLMLPSGVERQYSLTNYGDDLTEYVVGVKLDPNSRGGSLFMHNQLRVGTKIVIESPVNNFPLVEDAEHVVLVAGGIGVTPIYCIAKRLIELGRSWELHYSTRSRADAAFLKEFEQHEQVHFHFDDENEGKFLNVSGIVGKTPPNAHLYCCGPKPMLDAFEKASEGRSPDHIHVEYFTPKYEAADEGGFTVVLAHSEKEINVPEGKTILQVLREAGLDVPFSCDEGICGACETRVVEGIPDHRDSILTESERKQNATMMICCSGSKSPKLVLDI